MNKREFTEIAKKVLRSNKGLKSPQIMHPEREWLIGLFVAVVFFGTSAAWSAHMNIKYKNISVTGNNDVESDVVVYRESLVNSALQKFSSRQEIHESLLNSTPKIIAPEITNEVSSSTSSSLEVKNEATSSPQIIEEIVKNELPADAEVISPEEIPTAETPSPN